MNETQTEGILHIRLDGNSLDLPFGDLDIGFASSDDQIKAAVADYTEVPVSKMQNFSINRDEMQNSITLRPEAIFAKV